MDRYSRTIAVFKVVLPLTALAILATLFLLSRSEEHDATIPFADADVATRLKDQQITRPFFSGITPKGEEIMVTADVARPGGQGAQAGADQLDGILKMSGGQTIKMSSDSGRLDPGGDRATFQGNVEITTSTGLVVTTETLNAALNAIEGDAPGTIEGTGPIGDFTAGAMHFGAKSGDGDVHMLFKNGVKLIYDPKHSER